MRRNVEAALRCRECSRREMPWLDTPDYVLSSSGGELLCVSEPCMECARRRMVFVFRNGQYFHNYYSFAEYDTSRLKRLEVFAGERGWL